MLDDVANVIRLCLHVSFDLVCTQELACNLVYSLQVYSLPSSHGFITKKQLKDQHTATL